MTNVVADVNQKSYIYASFPHLINSDFADGHVCVESNIHAMASTPQAADNLSIKSGRLVFSVWVLFIEGTQLKAASSRSDSSGHEWVCLEKILEVLRVIAVSKELVLTGVNLSTNILGSKKNGFRCSCGTLIRLWLAQHVIDSWRYCASKEEIDSCLYKRIEDIFGDFSWRWQIDAREHLRQLFACIETNGRGKLGSSSRLACESGRNKSLGGRR